MTKCLLDDHIGGNYPHPISSRIIIPINNWIKHSLVNKKNMLHALISSTRKNSFRKRLAIQKNTSEEKGREGKRMLLKLGIWEIVHAERIGRIKMLRKVFRWRNWLHICHMMPKCCGMISTRHPSCYLLPWKLTAGGELYLFHVGETSSYRNLCFEIISAGQTMMCN